MEECGKCPSCRINRARRWVAHNSPWIVALLVMWRLPQPVEPYGIDVGYWLIVPVVALGVLHQPCPRCRANIPPNPRQAAARHEWALWTCHYWLYAYLGMVCSTFLFVLMPGRLAWWLLEYATSPIVLGAWIVIIRSRLRHNALHRYCPRCNPPPPERKPVTDLAPVLPGPRS